MPAVFTFNPGKTDMQIAALQVPIDYIGHLWSPDAIARCIAVLSAHFQLFKVVLYAADISGSLGISGRCQHRTQPYQPMIPVK